MYQAAMRLVLLILFVAGAIAAQPTAHAAMIGPGVSIPYTALDSAGTRTNVDVSTAINLPAGTYEAANFSFAAGQNGNVQPFLATSTGTPGTGAAAYSVIAAGSDNSVTTSGTQTVLFGGSGTFTVPLGGETVYAGITNSAPNNPVYTQLGAGLDDHNSPAFASPVTVAQSLSSFSNPGLNREYAFSVGVIQETNSAQNATPFSPPAGQLNLNVTGTASAGLLNGQEGTSTNAALLSDGQTRTGVFNNDASNVVTVSDNGTITYQLPHLSNITAIDTLSEWRDTGRVNQDYTVQVSTDGVHFSPLAAVAYDGPFSGGDVNTQVSLTSPLGPLASDVRAVQFVFGHVQNDYVGYTQLAIVGNPVPEPASVVLFGLGALGLIAVARRRRAG